MKLTRVLVVEDESIIGLDLRMRLEALGYQVVDVVPSGEEALRVAGEARPDLAFMDIVLAGDLDGVQTAALLRDRYDLPVIYLTAYSDGPTLERARLTEPFGYLIKPFDDRDLKPQIEMALRKHQLERQLRESERWLSTTLSSIGDGLIATNAAGEVRFMNPIAETLTGWSQAEALGRPATDVFKLRAEGQAADVGRDLLARALRGDQALRLPPDSLLLARDGRETPVDDSLTPIGDEAGGLHGAVLVFRDTTERRRAQALIEARERRFRALIEHNADGLLLIEPPAGRITYASPASARLMDVRELAERRLGDLIHPDDWLALGQQINLLYTSAGASLTLELRCRTARGWRWVEAVFTNLLAEPVVRAVVINLHDISERKQAEEALKRYQLLSENARDIILFVRLSDGLILEANQAALDAYGYNRAELLTRHLYDLRAPATRPLATLQMAQANLAGARFETLHQRRDGTIFPVEVNSRGATFGRERVLLSIIRDISERREAEAERLRLISLLRATLESTADGLLVVDRQGGLLSVNQKFLDLWGLSASLLPDRDDDSWLAVVQEHLVDPDQFLARVRALRAQPEADAAEQLTLKDGRRLECSAQPQWVGAEVAGRVWSFRDVTARVRAEQAERQERSLAEALHAAAAALTSTLEFDEVLERILSALERVIAHDAANIMTIEAGRARVRRGRGYAARGAANDLLDLEFPLAQLVLVQRVVQAGQPAAIPETQAEPGWVHHPATDWIRSHLTAPIRMQGRVVGVLNLDSATPGFFSAAQLEPLQVFADQAAIALQNAQLYASLREQAASLDQARRAAEEADRVKSQFLAHVTHELRTPLTGIRESLRLVLDGHAPGEESRFVRLAFDTSEKMLALVNDLLDLAKIEAGRMELRLEPVALAPVLAEVYDLLRLAAEAKGLTISLPDLPPDLPRLNVDPERLRQVLVNLVGNALKFTDQGGVAIEARLEAESGRLHLAVRDTGPGIPPELQGELFRPFVQLPAGGRSRGGTGLGLSIARHLTEQMGGALTLESAGAGQGSTFTCSLPCVSEAP